MRSELSKLLLRAVQEEMARRLPQFTTVRDKNAPGGKLFEWSIEGGSWAYVWVSPGRFLDTFSVEVAWNSKRGFPAHYTPVSERSPAKGYTKFGLAELWDEPNPVARWSVGPSTTMDLQTLQPIPVIPAEELGGELLARARDVVERAAEFAVPHFEAMALGGSPRSAARAPRQKTARGAKPNRRGPRKRSKKE
jgi:hypothetical protein